MPLEPHAVPTPRFGLRSPLRIATALIVALAAGHLLTSVSARQAVAGEPVQPKDTVELRIDFGDGFEIRYKAIPYRNDMTVLDAMKIAERHRHRLSFRSRGSGDTAFVYEINKVANEGARGRNWVFRVNGKLGDRSAGIYHLKSGDKVLWSFERYP